MRNKMRTKATKALLRLGLATPRPESDSAGKPFGTEHGALPLCSAQSCWLTVSAQTSCFIFSPESVP